MTGETPFKPTFGVEAMILVEVGELTFGVKQYSEGTNDQAWHEEANLISEAWEITQIREEALKQKVAKSYNTGVFPTTSRKKTLSSNVLTLNHPSKDMGNSQQTGKVLTKSLKHLVKKYTSSLYDRFWGIQIVECLEP